MKPSHSLSILPVALLLLVGATRHHAHRPTAAPRESAAQAQGQDVQGTFLFTPEGSDDVQAVIKAETQKLSFIKRPIARSRLRKTNQPFQWIRIEHTPTEVSLQMDGRKPIVTPADGKSIRWTREDGEVFDVNTVWQEGSIKETFVADDGSRENLFSLSPDGQLLTMRVTIRSPQLPAPIVYKLDYRKKT